MLAAKTDWGNLPAWLGLVGGLVAVLAFVVGRLDARRVLAAQVYAIVTSSAVGVERGGTPTGYVHVQPTNYGPAPIFQIRMSLHEYGRRRTLWRLRKPPHWWTGEPVAAGTRFYTAVTPATQGEIAELPPPSMPTARHFDQPDVVMSFRDGNGRPWVRWPDGELSSARLARRSLS